jgi:hypothetical protein
LAFAGLNACHNTPAAPPDADAANEIASDTFEDNEPTEAVAETETEATADMPAKPGPGEWQPDGTAQLFGKWASLTDGTVRALKFAQLDNTTQDLIGVTPVFWLYKYPIGQPPVAILRGRYEMTLGPALVLEPVWEVDNPRTPPPVTFTIHVSKHGQLALGTAAGVRIYDVVDVLP